MGRFLKLIFSFAIVLLAFRSIAQTDTIYYDKKWKTTTKDTPSYYRLATKLSNGTYKVEDHYMTGSLQMVGYYDTLTEAPREGKNGLFIYYDSSGNRTTDGNYVKGQRSGKWKQYYKGNVCWEIKYENNVFNGWGIYYDSFSHIKKSEGEYLKNKRYGPWNFYDKKTGELIAIENYNDGVLTGPSVSFDKNGHKTEKIMWDNGHRSGKTYVYYAGTDSVKFEMEFRNDILSGHSIYYDSLTHKKRNEGDFHNFERIGTWNYYDSVTGNLKYSEKYQQGDKHDIFIALDASGFKTQEGKTKNRNRTGEWRYFLPDGSISYVLNFVDNIPDGSATYYDSSTHEIIAEEEFEAGAKKGLWKTNYKNGDKKTRQEYDSGRLNGRYISFDTSGFVISEGSFMNNLRHGQWKFYYEKSNRVWIKQVFINDTLDGELLTYYKDGSLKRKEAYKKGIKLSGECYDPKGNTIADYPFSAKPKFSGDLMTYIGKHLVYPEEAKRKGIEGKVVIGFFINADGTISDINIVKGLGSGCDEEAKRLVAEMPRWMPMQLDGKYFQTYHTVPIVFWIHDN